MVFVCSPFAGSVQENIQNARRYSRFAYISGYMPITPHLMYPRFLDDKHYAAMRAGAMTRRGLGVRRVKAQLSSARQDDTH